MWLTPNRLERIDVGEGGSPVLGRSSELRLLEFSCGRRGKLVEVRVIAEVIVIVAARLAGSAVLFFSCSSGFLSLTYRLM